MDSGINAADLVQANAWKRVPKKFDDHGTTNWFFPFEMANITKMESLRFTTTEIEDELTQFMFDCHSQAAPLGGFSTLSNPKFYGTS